MRRFFNQLLLMSIGSLLLWSMSCFSNAQAQDTDNEPLIKRLVRGFDFDETKDGNFSKNPRFWRRLAMPGYPNYTEIEFSDRYATSGKNSYMLAAKGANAASLLEIGVVEALPSAIYQIEAKIRTEKMKYSRFKMTAIYMDQLKRPIPESLVQSRLMTSNKQWTTLSINMSNRFEKAAWIVVKLEVLQQDRFIKPNPLKVPNTDLDSKAYVDDLNVYLLPQIHLATQSKVNVVKGPDLPTIRATVKDYTADNVSTVLMIFDSNNQLVERYVRKINKFAPATWSYTPKLPRYGWYYANLIVKAGDKEVGRRNHAFVWTPPHQTIQQNHQRAFVIQAENLPQLYYPSLTQAMKESRAGTITLSAWTYATTSAELPQEDPLVQEIRKLYRQGFDIRMAMTQLPHVLAAELEVNTPDVISLLKAEPEIWDQYLTPILKTMGREVSVWQLGQAGSTQAQEDSELASLYPDFLKYIDLHIARPRLMVPWDITHDLEPDSRGINGLVVNVPNSISPQQIATRILQNPRSDQPQVIDGFDRNFRFRGDHITLLLNPLDPRQYSHKERLDDLALRMVYGWMSNPDALAIKKPWQARITDETIQVIPDATFGVWANMTERLAGRTFFAELYMQPGTRAFVLEGQGSDGAIVVWRTSSDQEFLELDQIIGEEVKLIDIHGNRQELEIIDGMYRIPLMESPQFIEGIDVPLAKFLAGFRFTPQLIKSNQAGQVHQLSIFNPFEAIIDGSVKIISPQNMNFDPQNIQFQNLPQQSSSRDIRLSVPLNQEAGPQKIQAEIVMRSPAKTYRLKINSAITIGLEGIEVYKAITTVNENDLEVAITVQNKSNERHSYRLFTTPANLPTQEVVILGLQPGRSAIRRFRFPGMANSPSGTKFIIKMREMTNDNFLNIPVVIP